MITKEITTEITKEVTTGIIPQDKPPWILATGFWNDDGVWDDNAVWID